MILRRMRESVRMRVLVLMLASALVALIVAGITLSIYEARTYHALRVTDITTQAQIVGRASAPALIFDDRPAARENLELVRARPLIHAAAIYDRAGQLFASYVRDGSDAVGVPDRAPEVGVRTSGGYMTLAHEIVEAGEALGTAYLVASYDLAHRIAGYMGILLVVFLVSMLAALAISAWLQRSLTAPIGEIATVAKEVMERRDFSLRVRKTTNDEIGFLVEAFNNMLAEIGRRADALIRADRMKDQFLATLAHELRNPLAPLSNALYLLEKFSDKPEVAAEARQMMSRQLRQMVRLVDDLLDVSRITTGKLVLHERDVDLRKAVESAIEIARPLIEARQHRLSVSLPPHALHVRGDETRLAQVFSNLLNNAAKYSEPGGVVNLALEEAAGEARVVVSDRGMGIVPEMLPHIFEMFTQADGARGAPQTGLGVGLALARQLVRMHGGSIEACSEGLGRGSRFVVRLPLLRGAADEPHREIRQAAPASAPARILVVDDNRDFAGSLAQILRASGHEVHVEHDGREAVPAAQRFAPEIAFLDIGLPGMSGYDIARELRAGAATSRIVLIAVTGWGQPADKVRAEDAGFDLHFVKPLDPDAIPSILERAAQLRKAATLAPEV